MCGSFMCGLIIELLPTQSILSADLRMLLRLQIGIERLFSSWTEDVSSIASTAPPSYTLPQCFIQTPQ